VRGLLGGLLDNETGLVKLIALLVLIAVDGLHTLFSLPQQMRDIISKLLRRKSSDTRTKEKGTIGDTELD